MTTTAITEPKAKVRKLTLHTETVQQMAGPCSDDRGVGRTPSGYSCWCPTHFCTSRQVWCRTHCHCH